jgi:hypothetical protein
MEKKSANEILRKIIREELTKVIREELPKLLSESVQPVKTQQKKTDQPPLTLNSSPMVKFEDIKFKKSSNPLANLLNETAMSMVNDENSMHFSTNDVGPGMHPALAFQPKEVAVGSASDMLATAKPSSNIDAVQINVVPDYSAMMEKMGL